MAVEEKLLYLRERVRPKIEPCLNILAFFTSRCSPISERLEKASKEAKIRASHTSPKWIDLFTDTAAILN